MSDDFRDGNYPGLYRLGSTYQHWMGVRGQIGDLLKLDPAHIWCFFLGGHIGDHVSGLTLIGAFKRLRNNPPIAVISTGPPDLHVLFEHCANAFVGSSPWDLTTLYPLTRFQPGFPFIAEPHFYADGRLLDLFPACTFNDLMRFTLRLPMHTPLVPPIVPAAARDLADRLFATYGLAPDRTVLLAPYSNSAPRMPVAWWAEAADYMKQHGLLPVTNVPNHYGIVKREEPIPGTIGVDVPLLQIIPFIERAGFFMASAQGLCDLASFTRARLKIIQTPAHFIDGIAPEAGGSAAGGYSVVRNFAPADCHEFDLRTDAPFDRSVLHGWLD
ncbi:MAG: hypothetical protein HY060_04150 [Proteobacteria bacterium]|nr:hypothetical protein [Pseudomonadota bacterium]